MKRENKIYEKKKRKVTYTSSGLLLSDFKIGKIGANLITHGHLRGSSEKSSH